MSIKRGINTKIIYIVLIILTIAIIAILIYFFVYMPECENIECFKDALLRCKRMGFLNERENSVWIYKIKGFSGGECKIYAKLISIKTDTYTGSIIAGKDMTCYIPKNLLGAFMPEEKIEYCHGILKEEIQRLMIEKMHLYIVQNIKEISIAPVI
ncbi:MAG: hypothetical protein QW041_02995 [Candidatus Pacearchaeota archaeon]